VQNNRPNVHRKNIVIWCRLLSLNSTSGLGSFFLRVGVATAHGGTSPALGGCRNITRLGDRKSIWPVKAYCTNPKGSL